VEEEPFEYRGDLSELEGMGHNAVLSTTEIHMNIYMTDCAAAS
jgi:hypothetical protein